MGERRPDVKLTCANPMPDTGCPAGTHAPPGGRIAMGNQVYTALRGGYRACAQGKGSPGRKRVTHNLHSVHSHGGVPRLPLPHQSRKCSPNSSTSTRSRCNSPPASHLEGGELGASRWRHTRAHARHCVAHLRHGDVTGQHEGAHGVAGLAAHCCKQRGSSGRRQA